jgi:hypothetical protein
MNRMNDPGKTQIWIGPFPLSILYSICLFTMRIKRIKRIMRIMRFSED